MDAVSVDSGLEEVTVYAHGARVRRITRVGSVAPRIRITGLPLAVIDDTVRVSVDGPAIATMVRTGVDVPAETSVGEEPPEVREARRQLELAEAEIARLQSGLEQLEGSELVVEEPGDAPAAPWGAVVAARRGLVKLRAARELALREAMTACRRTATEMKDRLAAVVDRDRREGGARPAKPHELRKQVDIDLVATGDPGELTIHLEYVIEAARWAPSYVARIDGKGATIEIRAVVAQDSGEDWAGVPLRLSTAEPTRFASLPELAAQRIGRRQAQPARGGFRPPPRGAAALYADYARDLVRRRPPTDDGIVMPEPAPEIPELPSELAGEVWDEDSSAAKERFATPPRGTSAPPAKAFDKDFDDDESGIHALADVVPSSRVQAFQALEQQELKKRATPRAPTQAPAPPPPPRSVPRLDYGNLVMAPPSSPSRGMLIEPPLLYTDAISQHVAERVGRLVELDLPDGCADDWSHAYDYAYTTEGRVDVRADGAWHSIAVSVRPSAVALRHVAVPREQPDVFRVATIANPFDGPLLPGPIDVYDRGRFLVTSTLDHAPPRAPFELGLGVDPAVKVARNTSYREEHAGMLRGALRLHHAIAIDVDNVSATQVDLEVRERIPVTREAGDDDVEVTIANVEPPWEHWVPEPEAPGLPRLRGGHRWRLAVPAGHKRTLRAAYEIRIASKAELIGGNRRES